MIPVTQNRDGYSVRQIERSDIEELVPLCRGLLDEGALHKLEYNERKVEAWFRTLLGAPHKYMHRLITTEVRDGSTYIKDKIVGVFVFYLETPFFATNIAAYDGAMYIMPRYRGLTAFRTVSIIEEYKRWARRAGAKEIFLGVSSGINPDTAERLFTSLKFVRAGGIYVLGER